MRKLITLFSVFLTLNVGARHVSPEQASQTAAKFFNSSPTKISMIESVNIAPNNVKQKENNEIVQPFYVFSNENNEGFVIISGDDRTQAVLGYSESGSFDVNNVPPQLEWLLEEYQKQIENLSSDSRMKVRNESISPSEDKSPLLTTKWGQSAPYNSACPIVDGARAVTGCVATAMAQIINYEKKTNRVEAIPDYDFNGIRMPSLPAREFSLGNLDNEGIADLMLYCGQSVRMNYSPQESGAYDEDVPEALIRFFGFDPELKILERSNYNDQHWNRMVREILAENHPIYYSAVKEGGGGHAFVIDGISDDFYHVNWGWDGNFDGYYTFQPLGGDSQSEYIRMQRMITTRDDDYSADVITYGTTIDGINYELHDNLTAMVLPLKNGEKYRGDLVIPAYVSHDGKTYKVNYFGPNAFVRCAHLESITIPATIEGQEWSIYDGCTNLHKVNVEDMVAFIKIDIGGWWTGSPLHNGADLYHKGELVKNLVIPDGIEKITYVKFGNCTSIESVTFPKSMTYIGQGAFLNCPKLKTVDMENSSIETIELQAFLNDESIEEITLPSTLRLIVEEAFGQVNGPGCRNLKKIVVKATTPPWSVQDRSFTEFHYGDAVVYVPDESVEKYQQAKEWCKFVDIRPISEEIPLPETATVTYQGLIYEINLRDRFAKVFCSAQIEGFGAFTIPPTVTYNGESFPVEEVRWEGMYGLTVKNVDAPLRKIGMSSFRWADFKDTFTTPETLEKIPYRAFAAAYIPKLVLSKNVKSIDSQAFGDETIENREFIGEIESRNPQPPVIKDDTFAPITYKNTPLKVPYGSKKAYINAEGWCNFVNISNIGSVQEELFSKDLTLSANLLTKAAIRNKMPLKVEGNIINSGSNKISSFTLALFVDGEKVGERNYHSELYSEDKFAYNETFVPVLKEAGSHEMKISLTIDGFEDEDLSDNEVTMSFQSIDKGYYRVSLIEQFTSEQCSLTPFVAPKVIKGINESGYSDFVSHVTHHCGFYDDFLTVNHDYEWFYNAGGGTYTPAMMLNRSDIFNTGYTPIGGIPDDVDRYIINEAGLCEALVSVYCEVENDKICVKTLLEKEDDFDVEGGYDYLTVFLVEDSIPAQAQLDVWEDDGYAKNYIHRNTLRKVLTDVWGNRISWKDDICALKFECGMDESWNKDNLKAVAFLHRYDPTSPVRCEVYTSNSSDLPQYGRDIDENEFLNNAIVPINADNDGFEVYTLTGIRIRMDENRLSQLPAGIYIVRRGNDVRKIVIR